jgi:hypothetical protein
MACRLSAPCQLQSLAAREHGRTSCWRTLGTRILVASKIETRKLDRALLARRYSLPKSLQDEASEANLLLTVRKDAAQ